MKVTSLILGAMSLLPSSLAFADLQGERYGEPVFNCIAGTAQADGTRNAITVYHLPAPFSSHYLEITNPTWLQPVTLPYCSLQGEQSLSCSDFPPNALVSSWNEFEIVESERGLVGLARHIDRGLATSLEAYSCHAVPQEASR
jgi:hypothetical protein